MKKFVLSLCCLLLLCGCSFEKKDKEEKVQKKESEKEVVKEYNLSFIAAGDSLIHSALYYDAKTGVNTYDFTKMFTSIKPIVEKYDIAFVNQETIIGGKSLGLSSYPRFNSPEEIGDALIDTGFDVINLANNHTLDMNEIGIINSTNYWKDKPVITIGTNSSLEERNQVKTYEKNGITYAILSYTTVTNGLKTPNGKEYLLNVYSEDKVREDIEKVRDKVDVVMVSMHYGSEYTHTPTQEQTEIANYLSNLDVDVVIGHHPHVIQPITHIGKTLVIYSLGNFISGQIGLEKQIGMLASFNINKKVTGDRTEISINNVKGDLIYTYNVNNSRNYKVYPFNELNDSLLPNYKTYEQEYGNIINEYDKSILVNTYNWGN